MIIILTLEMITIKIVNIQTMDIFEYIYGDCKKRTKKSYIYKLFSILANYKRAFIIR